MERSWWRRSLRTLLGVGLVVASLTAADGPAHAYEADQSADVYPLVFPIAGKTSYVDTWGAPRSGGRKHKGTDIFAPKLTPVVAAGDGIVVKVAIGKLAGRYIAIDHPDGWRTYYIHLNNDSPGTDDGLGGEPVPGILPGAEVRAGQLIDYVGDSGNAEGTSPHLHFELHRPDGSAVNPYPHLRRAQDPDAIVAVEAVAREAVAREAPPMLALNEAATTEAAGAGPSGVPPPMGFEALNTSYVGHAELAGGFAADVAVHDGTAYVGTWGRPGRCPGSGMRAIDVTNPEAPEPLSTFAGGADFPGTAAESLWVGTVDTPSFTGDLAVVALRLCDNDGRGRRQDHFRGLALYDVGEPAAPVLLGSLGTGERTQGANDVSVAQTEDGTVLVAATVRQSLIHTKWQLGDVRFIDATDPASPVEIADWDLRAYRRDMIREDAEEEYHAHAVELAGDGRSAWVAHWDGGAVLLDLTDPTLPRLEAVITPPPGDEGNWHSVAFDEERGLLVANAEDFFPAADSDHAEGWGTQWVYDVGSFETPVDLAAYATERSLFGSTMGRDGIYSAHDTVLTGTMAVSAWYSDGARFVDLADPERPVEVGSFVPPARPDPLDYWWAPDGSPAFPMVWGVDVVEELVYLSDMNSGLWIVRLDATPEVVETVDLA